MVCFLNSILTDESSLIARLLEPQVAFLTHNRSFDSHFHGDSDAYYNSIFLKNDTGLVFSETVTYCYSPCSSFLFEC